MIRMSWFGKTDNVGTMEKQAESKLGIMQKFILGLEMSRDQAEEHRFDALEKIDRLQGVVNKCTKVESIVNGILKLANK